MAMVLTHCAPPGPPPAFGHHCPGFMSVSLSHGNCPGK
uniref:Uncharacterized protein n=1 Tax=Anguilla anguilla TaxID=7936 RepID=A0A0E9QUF4_ANGAN